MSKGPGKWQSVILKAIETYTAVYVISLLPQGYTRANYTAILRATNSLEAAKKIETDRYHFGAPRLVAKRPGCHVSRDLIISVDKVTSCDLINT